MFVLSPQRNIDGAKRASLPVILVDAGAVVLLLHHHHEGDGGDRRGHEGVGDPARVDGQGGDVEQEEEDLDIIDSLIQ